MSGVAEVWLYSAEPCRDAALSDREFRLLEIPRRWGPRLRLDAAVCARRDVSLAEKNFSARLRGARAHRARVHGCRKLFAARNMAAAFETFDTIFVVSEGLQNAGICLPRRHPGKIQWIHTDYAAWRELN